MALRSSFATFRSNLPLPPASAPPPVTVAFFTSRTLRSVMLCSDASSRTLARASISGSSFLSMEPGFAFTIDTGPATTNAFGSVPSTGFTSARPARSASGAPGANACGFT